MLMVVSSDWFLPHYLFLHDRLQFLYIYIRIYIFQCVHEYLPLILLHYIIFQCSTLLLRYVSQCVVLNVTATLIHGTLYARCRTTSLVTSASLSGTCPQPANSPSSSWKPRTWRRWTWVDCLVSTRHLSITSLLSRHNGIRRKKYLLFRTNLNRVIQSLFWILYNNKKHV